ncbi:MAG: gliding motility lipoprotein GldB [Flavobacteriaceae bacterium]
MIISLFVMVFSCKETPTVNDRVAQVQIDFQFSRFDNEFADASPDDLPALREKYPYLFPAPDSVWVAKMGDTIQKELRSEVQKAFSEMDDVEADLELMFKHIKYYFPQKRLPKVITVTNSVNYADRVIWTDSLLFISLDNYLGPEHHFYARTPRYVAKTMQRRFIIPDVAQTFAQQVVPRPKNRSFLAQMIYHGKILYVMDRLMPLQDDAEKLRYTEDELAWVRANEEPMWRYFVERDLLYSTDHKLGPKFLEMAPFSKFGLELDNDSPGQVGRYLGWQIVRGFMERNSLEMVQMLPLPAEEIFNKANYKPRR